MNVVLLSYHKTYQISLIRIGGMERMRQYQTVNACGCQNSGNLGETSLVIAFIFGKIFEF